MFQKSAAATQWYFLSEKGFVLEALYKENQICSFYFAENALVEALLIDKDVKDTKILV